MHKEIIEPQILKNWKSIPEPKCVSVKECGQILDYTYKLLEHPVFYWEDRENEDFFINLMETSPDEYTSFNRTIIERIIHEAYYYGNKKFDYGILTLQSQGINNVIDTIKDFVVTADEIVGLAEDERFKRMADIHSFRIWKRGTIRGAVKYFLMTCRQLILDIRIKIWEAELKHQGGERAMLVFLNRVKANLFQSRNSTDSVILKGLVNWIDIELAYLDSIKESNGSVNEIMPLIEKFLAQQEFRTTADALLQHLIHSEIQEFCDKLSEMVLQAFSYHDISGKEPEKVYHSFLIGLFQSLNGLYKTISNREAGTGRFDIVLIPDHLLHDGVIIEVKKLENEKANTIESALNSALKQIKEREYIIELRAAGVKNYVSIATAFYGKKLYTQWNKSSI